MGDLSLTYAFFLIFTGAAVLSSVALFTRQPMIVAYIALGALVGPYGLGLIGHIDTMNEVAHIGIVFLLFLLGLDMQPRALLAVIRQVLPVMLVSSVGFAATGYGIARGFDFAVTDALVIGLAMMFSSTIIGIKLLPTTVLHHRHTGELMVGMLLLQDLLAIFTLLFVMNIGVATSVSDWSLRLVALPGVILLAFSGVRWVILPLLRRFDRFHEYLFLMAIGWCLGLAELCEALGLSSDIGAFIAGVSLASSPIAQYIATSLRPLRDFFLVIFFFALGAQFNSGALTELWQPALALAAVMLLIKPVSFRYLLSRLSESPRLAWDVGFRLGQISEFSLLVAFSALQQGVISDLAANLVIATAILTFVISSYIVIMNYPTPIATRDELRRD